MTYPNVLALAVVIAAAKPWHFWVGVVLTVTALALVVAVGLGYLFNVAALGYYPPGHPEYPKRLHQTKRQAIERRPDTPALNGAESRPPAVAAGRPGALSGR